MNTTGRGKIIFICSPLSGDFDNNIKIAIDICRQVALEGFNPIAPHLLYPRFLMEESQTERQIGMGFGKQLLSFCDEIWVFAFNGISQGMEEEIKHAKDLIIPVKYFYRWPMDILDE